MSQPALLLFPLLHAVLAAMPTRVVGLPQRWRLAVRAADVSLLLLLVLVAAATGAGEALTWLMLALVNGLAAAILRFSRQALGGEPNQARYLRAFHGVLGAVALVVVAPHLLVLIAAWSLAGLALQPLLTFYPERPLAQLAARKKFLMSRLADLSLGAAAALLFRALGTLDLAALNAIDAATAQRHGVQVAGVLLVVGVALRSAQLPFHGWLIQVMEAPTPVSALLHAGVANIGGFVMIRLAGLMGQLPWAQTLLVCIGTLTAVAAGLVAMTRVSVKVALAWSTCAQLGFMLLECGLDLPWLAALHLFAHSIYKAHAFLASGRAVEDQLRRDMAEPLRASLGRWLLGAAAGALAVGSAGWLVPHVARAWPLHVVLALAVAPLFVRAASARGALGPLLRALGFVALALAWQGALDLLSSRLPSGALASLRSAWVAGWFAALYVLQSAMLASPSSWLARRLYPWAFAGFYLDEPLTRLTCWLWPPLRSPSLPQGPVLAESAS